MSKSYNIREWDIKLNHNTQENKIYWEIINTETTNVFRGETCEDSIGIKPLRKFYTMVTNALDSKPEFTIGFEIIELKQLEITIEYQTDFLDIVEHVRLEMQTQTEIDMLKNQIKKLTKEVEMQTQTEIDMLKNQITKLTTEVEMQTQSKIDMLRNQITKLTTEVKMLRELVVRPPVPVQMIDIGYVYNGEYEQLVCPSDAQMIDMLSIKGYSFLLKKNILSSFTNLKIFKTPFYGFCFECFESLSWAGHSRKAYFNDTIEELEINCSLIVHNERDVTGLDGKIIVPIFKSLVKLTINATMCNYQEISQFIPQMLNFPSKLTHINITNAPNTSSECILQNTKDLCKSKGIILVINIRTA